jgi:chromosome segregation protein
VSAVQARYYEVGAEISRTEQTITHTREMRDQQRNELAQARATLAELDSHIDRDQRQIAELRAEIEQLGPELAQAQAAEGTLNEGLGAAEAALAGWQQRWEDFNREQGAAHQTTQVERARIEQLENQLRRLSTQSDRLAIERDALMAQESSALLGQLTDKESLARSSADELSRALTAALDRSQKLRAAQFEAEGRLEAARGERERCRAEVVSLEALQKAALGRGDSRTAEWLNGNGLAQQPRLAAQLSVRDGWERAVETALGDYLEALCVDELDALADILPTLPVGRISLLQAGEHVEADGAAGMLSGVVSGPAAIVRLLARVRLAETLTEALKLRREIDHDESVITRSGEWIGRDWLRVNRGGDPHSGVLEREQRLKQLRTELARSEQNTRDTEARLATCREELAQAERDRDTAQGRIQGAHREHADLLGQLEGERARAQESTLRRERLEEEAAEVSREIGLSQDALARARAELDRGLVALDALDSRRSGLETERDDCREAVQVARVRSQAAQLASRDLLIRIESRRSSETSMAWASSACPISVCRRTPVATSSRLRSPTATSPSSSWKLGSPISSRAVSTSRASSPPNGARSRRPTQPCARSMKSGSMPKRASTRHAPASNRRGWRRRNRVCAAKACSNNSRPRASTSPRCSPGWPPMRRSLPGKSR